MTEQEILTGKNGVTVLASLLERLGDVMGDGALRSLIHYGALDLGSRLADQNPGRSAKPALEAAARLLHFQIDIRSESGSRVELELRSPPSLSLDRPGPLGLATGILEGILSRVHHAQMRLESEPRPERDGYVFVYGGG